MHKTILPMLCGAVSLVGVLSSQAQTSTVTAGPNGVSGSTSLPTGKDGKPCKVVRSDGDPGTVSSSVTAGPDGVRGASSGGTSVTTRSSGNGGTSVSSSSGSGDGTTVTTTGDGDCVVTVPKSAK